jgi:hypothetical protein
MAELFLERNGTPYIYNAILLVCLRYEEFMKREWNLELLMLKREAVELHIFC